MLTYINLKAELITPPFVLFIAAWLDFTAKKFEKRTAIN